VLIFLVRPSLATEISEFQILRKHQYEIQNSVREIKWEGARYFQKPLCKQRMILRAKTRQKGKPAVNSPYPVFFMIKFSAENLYFDNTNLYLGSETSKDKVLDLRK